MGMFDTVNVVNISSDKFSHNGISFQTKCLENQLNEYVIFNNQLWVQYDSDKPKQYDEAIPVDLTDTINVYTNHKARDKVYWLEYNLEFESGKLIGVEKVEERITKDLSDKSELRPKPKTNYACVTVDFRGIDNKPYQAFMDELDANLEKIREIVCDPMAEIVYQVRPSENSMVFSSSPRWVHSFVQSLNSMTKIPGKSKKSAELNDGDRVTICVDECGFVPTCGFPDKD